MKTTEVYRQRHKLLKDVKAGFDQELIPAALVCDGNPYEGNGEDLAADGRTEMLTILLEDLPGAGTDAMGEFFFLPSLQGDELQVFMNIITVDEQIVKDRMTDLLLAIAVLNNHIPVGAFGIDFQQNNIIYRHSYEMPHPYAERALRNAVDLSMAAAVSMVKEYAYMLLDVNAGERDAESIEKFF